MEKILPTEKLGRRFLTNLPNVAKPTIFYDQDLKGFGLRVMPSGVRSWIVEYRPGVGGRGTAKRRMALGSADVLTPDQARRNARDILAAVLRGEDPAGAKTEARRAATIAELSLRYENEAGTGRKDGTKALYSMYWRLHIRPALGSIRAKELQRADIARLHRQIGADYPTTANRVVTLLAHFYEWLQKHDEVERGFNPAKGIERYRENRRERYLTTEELNRLGEAIREAETIGVEWLPSDPENPRAKHAPKRPESRRTTISPHAAAALRLLLFTGARLREILHLEWTHVDLERGLLFLPDLKTGKKTIVLGAPAIELLRTLPRIGAYVIAGNDPDTPRSDLKRPWDLVSRRAGLDGVRLHDLRHSFASVGAGAGLGLPIIGRLLGHADVATTARYAHLDADPLRRASDAISNHIAGALAGVQASVKS